MTVVFPDALGDLRAWLRAHPDLSPYHGGRVFFRYPETTSWPAMRLYQVGGGVQVGEAPIQDLRVALEIAGNKFSDYPSVRSLKTATESAVHQIDNTLANPAGTTLLQYGIVTSSIDSPFPDNGAPRYVIDALFTLRSTNT